MTKGKRKTRSRQRLALIMGVLLLLLPLGAFAAEWYVNTYDDSVGSGTSANPTSLVDAAFRCADGDVIILLNNITRTDERATARITANGVTVRSSDGNQFVINNDDDGTGTPITGQLLRVIADDFTLENVGMTGGSTTGNHELGGALYVVGDGATISHCTFTGNHTEGFGAFGGAVYISGTGAKVENSTFAGNHTEGEGAIGGAAYIDGANAQVVNSTFVQNHTEGGGASGGAVSISGTGVQVVNSTFDGNHTEDGGALGGAAHITGENAQVVDSTFAGNHTEGIVAHGGGAFIVGADSTIAGSTFEGNQANGPDSFGGGVAYGNAVTSADIKDTDFYGNTSTTGGGAITGTGTDITIWGVNYYQGNTPPGGTPVDINGEDKLVGIEAKSVTLAPGAQVIEGRRPALDESQIVGAGPNNRSSLYTVQWNLTIHQTEDPGSLQKGTLSAGTEVTVIQFSSGMALTSKGYVDANGLTRVTGQ